eukprot:6175349-Pleurochrysis_carterae.AAC.2
MGFFYAAFGVTVPFLTQVAQLAAGGGGTWLVQVSWHVLSAALGAWTRAACSRLQTCHARRQRLFQPMPHWL